MVGKKETKLPDDLQSFSHVYKGEEVRDFGIHLADGVHVIFRVDKWVDDKWQNTYYAYKITPELSKENGLDSALLLSRHLDEAGWVHVESPGDHVPLEKRTVKMFDRTYLVAGSLTFWK